MEQSHTIVVMQSPDLCIQKEEVFDVDMANYIIDNKDISKDERDAVRRIVKARVNGNKHITDYKLGKDIKHEFLGRFCAVKGIGLQCLSRECRAALAQKYYWDIDIRNAQPVLLQQYAEKRGWVCEALARYNQNRDEYIEELMSELSIERGEAKEKVCRILFGGHSEGMTPFFVRELQPEVGRLMTSIFNEHQLTYPSVAKRANATRSMMAFVLQSEERKCLLAMDRSLAAHGRSLDVLIHDGGLVRKKDGEVCFPEELLRKVEKDIHRATGYHVSLVNKPLVTTITREDVGGQDDYLEKKKAFEETGWKGDVHFKLRHPAMFISVDISGLKPPEPFSRTDMLQNEENNECGDGTSFIKRWLTDPQMREYSRMEFEPGGVVPPGCYNIFRGLPLAPVEGDWSLMATLLRLLVNHDPEAYEYVENWIAAKVQNLGRKLRVCLLFKGKKGVGKDTFWDQILRIFGMGVYGFNTSRPEHDVFARFNSQIAQTLLIKFEEANFQTNRDNENQLKSLITSPHATIEKKGHPIITVNSYVDCVMTTNQETPIPMTDDERRFAAFSVSEEKLGAWDWWADVHRKLADPKHVQAYYYHLLHKDIGDWTPHPVYKTRYYKDLVGVCSPIHARYFCDLLHEEGMDTNEEVALGSSHQLMAAMNARFPKFPFDNHTRFGIMMRDTYVDKGVISKIHGRSGTAYTTKPRTLRAYLEARGWWDEV